MLSFLPACIVIAHQVLRVSFTEVDSGLCAQCVELVVFGPVFLCVGIPVHREFRDLKHREGLLLLKFVVDVQISSLEAVVGHRVGYRLSHQTEVKCLVRPTHLGVLEPDVNVSHADSQILLNNR